jgi:hypothetical protein
MPEQSESTNLRRFNHAFEVLLKDLIIIHWNVLHLPNIFRVMSLGIQLQQDD